MDHPPSSSTQLTPDDHYHIECGNHFQNTGSCHCNGLSNWQCELVSTNMFCWHLIDRLIDVSACISHWFYIWILATHCTRKLADLWTDLSVAIKPSGSECRFTSWPKSILFVLANTQYLYYQVSQKEQSHFEELSSISILIVRVSLSSSHQYHFIVEVSLNGVLAEALIQISNCFILGVSHGARIYYLSFYQSALRKEHELCGTLNYIICHRVFLNKEHPYLSDHPVPLRRNTTNQSIVEYLCVKENSSIPFIVDCLCEEAQPNSPVLYHRVSLYSDNSSTPFCSRVSLSSHPFISFHHL